MTNTSTMFLNEMTVVDHAYINQDGFIVGGSFNPSFLVTGEIDVEEQVVVDFSQIKKDIKALIDDQEIGFDHKLWVSSQYSSTVSITYYSENSRVSIVTPHIELDLPANAVKFFDFAEYTPEGIGQHFASFLTAELQKKYPTVTVVARNTDHPHTIKYPLIEGNKLTQPMPVRYFHGLKHSTSFGCKNIAHGHLSFIQFEGKFDAPESLTTLDQLLVDIHEEYDNRCYIFQQNLCGNVISYHTDARGFFTLKFSDATRTKVFSHETTIENLVATLVDEFRSRLVEAGVDVVYFSEGLSKGAMVSLVG